MINSLKKKFHLTFDIDWAPDPAIELCLNILEKNNTKATFFATHHTDLNKEIIKKGHELGIHPNFLDGSSQGNSITEIIENCLKFAPEAKAMRTHALVQSTPLYFEIFSQFSQLKLDLSIFMHRAKNIERFKWHFNNIEFDRINYNWEDDAEFQTKSFNWSEPFYPGLLSIYDFHPIHVYLNSRNDKNYKNLKNELIGKSLISAPPSMLKKHVNIKGGAQSLLKKILESDAKSVSLWSIK